MGVPRSDEAVLQKPLAARFLEQNFINNKKSYSTRARGKKQKIVKRLMLMRDEGDEEEILKGIEALMERLKDTEEELGEVGEKVEMISRGAEEASKRVESIDLPTGDLASAYTASSLDVIVEEPYTEAPAAEGVLLEVKALAMKLLDFAEVKLEEGAEEEAVDFVKMVERLGVEDEEVSSRLKIVKGKMLTSQLEEEGTSPGVITDLETASEILELRGRVKEKIETLREVLSTGEAEPELMKRLEEAEKAFSEGRYFRALHICEEIGSALKKKLEYTLEMRTQALLDRVQEYIEDLERASDVMDPETIGRLREKLNQAVRLFLTQNLPQAYNLGQRILVEAKSIYQSRKTQNITRALLQAKAEMDELMKFPELKDTVDEIRELMAKVKVDLEKGTKEGVESAEENLRRLARVLEEARRKKEDVEKAEEYIRKITIKMVGLPEEERSKYSGYLSSIKEELSSGRAEIAREAAEKLYEKVSRQAEGRLRSSIEQPYSEVMALLPIFEALFPEESSRYEGIREELSSLYTKGEHLKLKARIEEITLKLSEELPEKVKTKLKDFLDSTVNLRILAWELQGAGLDVAPEIEGKLKLLKKIEKNPLESAMDLARYYAEVEKELKGLSKSSKEFKEMCRELSRHYMASLYHMAPRWIGNPIFLYTVEFALKRAVEFYRIEEYYLSYLILRKIEDVLSTHVEKGVFAEGEDEELKRLSEILPVGGYREKFYIEMLRRAEAAEQERRVLLKEYLKGALSSAVKS